MIGAFSACKAGSRSSATMSTRTMCLPERKASSISASTTGTNLDSAERFRRHAAQEAVYLGIVETV